MPLNWLNKNGLEDGNVPAGKECPFLAECGLRVPNCPSTEGDNIRQDHGFSCACARAISLTKYNEEEN